ncbi:MAG: UDP-N-acetylmuramoyl-L-alanyl-D-glutamate--2,6-diaminopimelate ligase [Treponemataceae bacterium]
MQRRLSELLTSDLVRRAAVVEGAGALKNGLDPIVTGLAYDSRKVEQGFLYFALPGLHVDGHSFIDAAVSRGAVAVLHQAPVAQKQPGVVYLRVTDSRFAMSPFADAFWRSPSRDLAVIGVTGTEGKSTTVYLIYQLLELAGKKAGFVSTVQYRTGDTEEWNPEHQTTPEAPTVHTALAAMRDYGMEYAVIESSSHGLSPRTNRLGDVAFDVGVMTNVTHEHLEFHGTWEQYREDKANLFRTLDLHDHVKTIRGVKKPKPSFGVVNADDPSAAYFAAATKKPTLTFSAKGDDADLSLRNVKSEAFGNTYDVYVRTTGETISVGDKLPGAFNAGNVLAALLVVSGLLNASVASLQPLIPKLRPVRGRMSVVEKGQSFEVVVDYAHTPSSFEAVFPPIRKRISERGGRVISLFGSGGERDRDKRPRQGRIAADYSDIVILSDEDPRGEVPMELLEEIAAGCPEKKRGEELFLIPDRPIAIRKAFSLARKGDLVILLGKGHENSIIYKNGTIPFDEIAEAEKALAEMGYGDAK